ncbi:MAG: histidine kinase [Pseudomonadota bacterium]|nr:histidine kinase [Pseudomonadota bacterium]
MTDLTPHDRRRARRAALRRAFAGLTWARAGAVAGLCLLWQFYTQMWDLPFAIDDYLASWLQDFALEYVSICVIAASMILPLTLVGNLGPQAGWRRLATMAIAAALVAPIAVAEQILTNMWLNDTPWTRFGMRHFFNYWTRYVELAALAIAIVEFRRLETRRVEAMHRAEVDRLGLEREMQEARLQVLQAQIEPHFLFNTLANVRRLYQTDVLAGREMLLNLMRYLEVALPEMRSSSSTVERELALIEAYLKVQQIRMGERLAFSLEVAPEMRAAALPPMMLLTLVENAVKHGLNPLPEGGTIVVAGRMEEGRLRFDVVDTGRGFHATSGGGTGLANITARLAALYGAAGTLALDDNSPRGVVSTLRVPAEASPA